jgi:hypothetical protein
MTPIEAIVVLEENCAIHVGNVALADAAWQTLKATVLAQQSTNNAIPKLSCKGCADERGENCDVCIRGATGDWFTTSA